MGDLYKMREEESYPSRAVSVLAYMLLGGVALLIIASAFWVFAHAARLVTSCA